MFRVRYEDSDDDDDGLFRYANDGDGSSSDAMFAAVLAASTRQAPTERSALAMQPDLMNVTDILSKIAEKPYADHTLIIGNISIPVHRVILSKASCFFRTAFDFQASLVTTISADTGSHEVITGAIGFAYMSHGFIEWPGTASRDVEREFRQCLELQEVSYEVLRKLQVVPHSDKEGALAALRLFKLDNLVQAYKVASYFQLEQLQKSLILLLTPVNDISRDMRTHNATGPLRTLFGGAMMFSTCYDFAEAFSNDAAMAPFRQALDGQLLSTFPEWKHVPHNDQTRMHYRPDRVHSCTAPLPLNVPFDHVDLAFNSIIDRLALAMKSDGDTGASIDLALCVLDRETKELTASLQHLLNRRSILKRENTEAHRAGGATEETRAACATIKQQVKKQKDLVDMETAGIQGRVRELSTLKKASVEGDFWNDLSTVERSIMKPHAACVYFDTLKERFGRHIPSKYIKFLILAMDQDHLKQRLFPWMRSDIRTERVGLIPRSQTEQVSFHPSLKTEDWMGTILMMKTMPRQH